MNRKWPKILVWIMVMFAILSLVAFIAVSFIAKTAIDGFESDCKSFAKVVYGTSGFLGEGKELNTDNFEESCQKLLGKECKVYLVDAEENNVALAGREEAFDAKTLEKDSIIDVDQIIKDDSKSTKVKKHFLEDIKDRFNRIGKNYVYFQQLIRDDGKLYYCASYHGSIEGKIYVEMPAQLSSTSVQSVIEAVGTFIVIITIFLIVILIFITTQWASKSKLMKLAYVDPVTKGMNWLRFKQVARKRIRKKSRHYSLIVFQSDSHDVMREMFGHKKCEELLRVIYTRLYCAREKREAITRIQEGMFAVLWKHDSEERTLSRIKNIEKMILTELPANFVHYRFGVLEELDYGISMERQMNYARLAMNKVDIRKECNVQFFRDELRDRLLKEKKLESNMEEALTKKEYKMYLQPKYSSDGSKICGAEALVRWISPSMGFISPGEFIPLFEKNQFIRKLDEYMLRRVCEFQKNRLEQEKKMVTISVNLSRVNLSEEGLVKRLAKIVDEYELPHEHVEFELTESTFFEGKEILVNTTGELRENGFSVSMDDFGSGYSSLNSLKDIRMDVVKLDAEFFRGGEGDKERSTIVIQDTVALAKHLNMKIVAEGIETREQVDFLNGIGCDLIQGFYFAKPMREEDFTELLDRD